MGEERGPAEGPGDDGGRAAVAGNSSHALSGPKAGERSFKDAVAGEETMERNSAPKQTLAAACAEDCAQGDEGGVQGERDAAPVLRLRSRKQTLAAAFAKDRAQGDEGGVVCLCSSGSTLRPCNAWVCSRSSGLACSVSSHTPAPSLLTHSSTLTLRQNRPLTDNAPFPHTLPTPTNKPYTHKSSLSHTRPTPTNKPYTHTPSPYQAASDKHFVPSDETMAKEWKEVQIGMMEIRGLSARMQETKGLVLEIKEMEDMTARILEIREMVERAKKINEIPARFLVVKEAVVRILELKEVMKEVLRSRMAKKLANSSSIFEEEDNSLSSLSHVSGHPVPRGINPNLNGFVSDLGVYVPDKGVLGPDLVVHVHDMEVLAMVKVREECTEGLVIILRDSHPSLSVLGMIHPLVQPSIFVFDGGGWMKMLLLC